MTTDTVTRNQLGALEAIDQHGHLRSGWGGYSQATMMSLARRNLARHHIVDERQFSVTARGRWVIREQYALTEYAGCRDATVCPETQTLVLVMDGDAAGLDTDDGRQRWSTVCDDHGHVVCHETLALAREWAKHPLDWCETCMADERHRANTAARLDSSRR